MTENPNGYVNTGRQLEVWLDDAKTREMSDAEYRQYVEQQINKAKAAWPNRMNPDD